MSTIDAIRVYSDEDKEAMRTAEILNKMSAIEQDISRYQFSNSDGHHIGGLTLAVQLHSEELAIVRKNRLLKELDSVEEHSNTSRQEIIALAMQVQCEEASVTLKRQQVNDACNDMRSLKEQLREMNQLKMQLSNILKRKLESPGRESEIVVLKGRLLQQKLMAIDLRDTHESHHVQLENQQKLMILQRGRCKKVCLQHKSTTDACNAQTIDMGAKQLSGEQKMKAEGSCQKSNLEVCPRGPADKERLTRWSSEYDSLARRLDCVRRQISACDENLRQRAAELRSLRRKTHHMNEVKEMLLALSGQKEEILEPEMNIEALKHLLLQEEKRVSDLRSLEKVQVGKINSQFTQLTALQKILDNLRLEI